MLAPADQPPDDILDYVVVDTDKTGQIRVRVVEGKKHLRAVQDYLTRLCSRYPGKVSPFEFTTLDVIARLRQETVISGVENGINPVQQKMLGYPTFIHPRSWPLSGYTRFMINPETRVIAVDLNNVAGDKTPAGRLKTGIMYLLAGQIAGGDFTLPQYRDEVLKQLPREYHEIALKRINQLDQEVKTKVYDELHNARGIDFIWENLDTQEREQRKFAIRTVLSTQYLRDYPESVLKSANTLWLLRYKPEDIPVLRDNFNVPEFMLKRFLKMPEGPAPDGSGVPVLGVFRVKSGTLARILKFTVGPLELWALNSSPKDSALRKTLTNKLGSVRARKILAENFPRGSATSLIEHRAGQHNSDNVIEDLASELIRKQGYNL